MSDSEDRDLEGFEEWHNDSHRTSMAHIWEINDREKQLLELFRDCYAAATRRQRAIERKRCAKVAKLFFDNAATDPTTGRPYPADVSARECGEMIAAAIGNETGDTE